jgi:excisionase family DNA binding protein
VAVRPFRAFSSGSIFWNYAMLQIPKNRFNVSPAHIGRAFFCFTHCFQSFENCVKRLYKTFSDTPIFIWYGCGFAVRIRIGERAVVETYLTIEGLAEYLKLAEQTVRRWVLNREVPFHKIKKVIRFRLSEIEKWVDEGGLILPDEGKDNVEGDLFKDTLSLEQLAEKELAEEETGDCGTGGEL